MKYPVAEFECLDCNYTDYRMSTRVEGEVLLNECPKCKGDMRVKSRGEAPEYLRELTNLVDRHFKIWDFVTAPGQIGFSVTTEDQKISFQNLLEDLRERGYIARMKDMNGGLSLIVERMEEPEESSPLINILLFFATIGTTLGIAGYWFLYHGNILRAALFSTSLLSLLAIHELGHEIATQRHKVKSTWPYFIPIPIPLIGTMGAIIKNKTPIPRKDSLMEIGVLGPVLGFIVAVPVTLVGLHYSHPLGGDMLQPSLAPFQNIPTPAIFAILGMAVFGHFPLTLDPHPLAWAGFLTFFITWLNLLPTGQLDGGHMARALMKREHHSTLTLALGTTLLFLGIIWLGFIVLAIIILFFFSKPHQGALDNTSELARNQKILAIVAITVFILCFPIPLWMV